MSSKNTRIAKNSLSLYLRMLITMGVSLYTARVVLQTLGVSDYGLNTVVGGVVTMFSFLSGTMASATQRFLNYEQGTEDDNSLRKVFSTSLYIHYLIALVVLVLAETAGLWFLNTRLNIPEGRMVAANWVYQFSILSFVLTVVNVPYNAAIIANERMTAFAYISVIDVVLKLLIVYLLQLFMVDKLILYGFLTFCVTFAVRMAVRWYSRKNFEECRVGVSKDETFFKKMMGFSGWTMMSSVSVVLRNQGIAVVLNMFFGTVVNAAQGISNQINTVVTTFARNFTQAVNPQIVKQYAAGDLTGMKKLLVTSVKMSFFLILLISLPIFIEAPFILKLWLGEVPEHTVVFVRLVMVRALIESYANPVATAQAATGKVRNYHITLSVIGLMNLPISYVMLMMGYEPESTLVVAILLSALISFIRVSFLRKSIGFKFRDFLTGVLLPSVVVIILAVPIPGYLYYVMPANVVNFIIKVLCACATVLAAVYLVGLSKQERNFINNIVIKKILGKRKK
ncbi:hypothetical protein [Echinicola vietnamensis]|uniref:Na+-driven multidrug efflux pump n=1 Tax=Echinicola vietnamensis (strain DSM 17526 / LMG 23754 / KMM 6221) TaxID=926556 RepID=L0G6H9_ECHVK|nr:hypothetical protein [Echinicola vietnamensis]AGA80596.1 hypothetical protein Echvi_4412 [Echinicola vietnamensis DSM 17526]